MKIALFSNKEYDESFFHKANESFKYEISYLKPNLNKVTAELAKGHDAICAFVNDDLSAPVLEKIASFGIKIIALRCAGYNNVDLNKANELGINILRVPEYSPMAVAEHTIGLILTLSRKFHKAYNRTREGNFALDGFIGFDLNEKTVGVIGTGKIGQSTIKILNGFGSRVIAYDPYPIENKEGLNFEYVSLEELYKQSDIISLHCPLVQATHHIIDEASIKKMKPGVVIINTSRGALIDTEAVIEGLKEKKISGFAIDVYEEEADLFFEDLSSTVIQDDTLMRLMMFPNVIVTGHQAFLTERALTNIAETSLSNIASYFNQKLEQKNLVCSIA